MLEGQEYSAIAASLTVVAALFFLRRYKQNVLKDDGKNYPPSLPVLPFVRAILSGGMTAIPEHFMRSAEKLGPVFSSKMGSSMLVVLNGYEAIVDAFVRHSEAFADREVLFTEKNMINHELRGIAYSSYNDAYKKHHKLILTILKEFGFGVQNVTETRILQEVETMNDEIRKQNGRPFGPKTILISATSNVTLSILYGRNFLQSLPKVHSAIVKNSVECVSNTDMTLNMVPAVRFLPMFWKTIQLLRSTSEALLKAIEVGIQFNKSNKSEPTFISRFLEIEGANYIHKDLLYILRDLSFGSTDTVSTTLQWAVVELANHPEVQTRFQKEIDEMVPGDRLPSLDDKQRLPYTEATILEIMRRRTVVPLFVPHKTLKDTKVLEFDVPKGTMIMPNGYSAHMDEKFWNDPENFRPERFLDADNKININYSKRVIPFGLGKRSCIGEVIGRQSVFLFVTSLVQSFDIRPPEGQKTINVKEHSAVTTAPTHYEVRLIPRVKPKQ